MVKTKMAVRGAGSSLNSPEFPKIYKKGFSIAEALVALLIGSLVLGMSAPIISKQLKHNKASDAQASILLRRIERLERNQNGVEDGAVMFYASDSCPENWAKITGFGGYYLRIQNTGETIGTTKEQMVHRHKHVSPMIRPNWANNFRYGPYAPSTKEILGDYNYPSIPSSVGPDIYTAYPDQAHHYSWLLYTSDGMNRIEDILAYASIRKLLTCPNRDEGDKVCKKTGNQYDVPYLSHMPLVGDENRPNSLVLTACVKGYTTCSMVDNKLNCTK